VLLLSSSVAVAKKNTKSQVWCHFGLKQVDGKIVETDKPVCRECSVQVCAKLGNTSNLFSHLKMNRPDLYAKSSQSKGLSKPNSHYKRGTVDGKETGSQFQRTQKVN